MGATIGQVAMAAGVSITTVSRALNRTGRISKSTRTKVAQTARDLGYVPNHLARSLLARSTQMIAVVTPSTTNPFFPNVVAGLSWAARAKGHLIVVVDSADSEEAVWTDLASLRRKQVDGLVIIGAQLSSERLQAVCAGIPVIVVDRAVDLDTASIVRSDHRAGAALATQYLVGLGHERIALIMGPAEVAVSADRLYGYQDGLAASDIEFDPDLVFSGGFTEAEGAQAGDALLESGIPFTAVFAGNDLAAIGLMKQLKRRGVNIPDDVSVVGYDGISLGEYVTPSLTTIRQDAFLLGATAAQMLIDISERSDASVETKTLPVELIVRESTGPAKGASKWHA